MEVFVFPILNVTLFPGTTKPLNVFDPRYVQMVKDSITAQIPVALAFLEEESLTPQVAAQKPSLANLRPVAGFGNPRIIEERENGSLLVFLAATGKLHMRSEKKSLTPYLICEGEAIEETHEIQPQLLIQVHTLNKILARWIHTHIPDPSQRDFFIRNLNGPAEIIASFSSYLIKDPDMQQELLALNDINDRVEMLTGLTQSGEMSI